MFRFYSGTKKDFTWKPIIDKVIKEGEYYDGLAYGIYWLKWGATITLLRSRTHDFLLQEDPTGFNEDLRTEG